MRDLMGPGQFRVALSEWQAERLQRRLTALPFKVNYQEEQHGATLMVCLACTPSQEKSLREILNELGADMGRFSAEE